MLRRSRAPSADGSPSMRRRSSGLRFQRLLDVPGALRLRDPTERVPEGVVEVLGHRVSRARAVTSLDPLDDAKVVTTAIGPAAVQRRKVDASDEDVWPQTRV